MDSYKAMENETTDGNKKSVIGLILTITAIACIYIGVESWAPLCAGGILIFPGLFCIYTGLAKSVSAIQN